MPKVLNLESLLKQVKELPSLPEIYIRVSELLDDDDSTAEEIGDAVQVDPSISSRILKIVNSAYYGLPQPVSSISQTVSLLGSTHLKNILIGAVLAGVFKTINNNIFSMESFWKHSVKTAMIARHLAMQNAHIIDHDALFTAGLLHDIGRLVLVDRFPEHVAEVEGLLKNKGIGIVQAESEVLGFAHTDVGEILLQQWDFPYLLIQCAIDHHEIDHESPFANASSIVYLANQLSQFAPPQNEEEVHNILNKIPNWQQCQCTVEQIRISRQLAEVQVYEVMESFGMGDIEISCE